MSTRVFLTGDRSQGPLPAAQIVAIVMQKVLADNPDGVHFLTGDSPSGIERAVRYVVPEGYVTVVKYPLDAEGHQDFDAALSVLKDVVDKAVVIHVDPLNSRLAKSVVANFKDVEFPLDAIVNQTPDTIPDDMLGGDESATEEKE